MDDKYFKSEILPHYKYVLGRALKICRDEDVAKDLVQDTFIKAFKYLHTYTPGSVKGWLCRILKNTYIDRLRAKKDPCAIPGSNLPIEKFYDPIKLPVQFQKQVLTQYFGDEVANAITTLTPSMRQIMIWIDVDGYSYEEVAKMMNCKTGTIKSRMFQARQKLRLMLRDYANECGIKTYN